MCVNAEIHVAACVPALSQQTRTAGALSAVRCGAGTVNQRAVPVVSWLANTTANPCVHFAVLLLLRRLC